MPHDWQRLKDDWVELLLSGQEAPAIEQTRALLADGVKPQDFFENIITPALEEIGRRFEELEIFLPELAIAGETVQATLAKYEHLFQKGAAPNAGLPFEQVYDVRTIRPTEAWQATYDEVKAATRDIGLDLQ